MSAAPSPSSSSSSTSFTNPTTPPNPNPNPNPIQSWWESLSKARSRILSLSSLLSLPLLSSLADSDRPAASLLSSSSAYSALSSALLSDPLSGSGDSPLCQWLYDTFHLNDPDLSLVVLSFLPLLISLYLSRLLLPPSPPSLAGFESLLLTIYHHETRRRSGKPQLVTIPDLSQPSLYHTPRSVSSPSTPSREPAVGVVSPPLEPQMAVKSTKRACIVGVALDCYYRKISSMPVASKIDFCEAVVSWAGQDCSCRSDFDRDDESLEEDGESVDERCNGDGNGSVDLKGCRIQMPWELMQPVLRILGHCLLAPRNPPEVRDVAAVAVRSVYARASHELMAQAILAARSLIQLDNNARKEARGAAGTVVVGVGGTGSNPATPGKPKKPEVLLVSK